ncbi:hypothetical protein CMO88_00735 [Candidatus Woesearchaeota archaeon]|nr:hypothetical protein [Candidatus Woesearchaeota archaeon]|tara:strand:- start:4647 stop:5297 length:651 start_codon:yes stop_codon:yes gene_type:complete
MITHEDQLELFKLISDSIAKDMECWAFGGNAMMFYGYKDETKDVDLLFDHEEDRAEFIKALEKLGFWETGLSNIYVPEKLKDKYKPLMYTRYDIRFDLFVKKVFKTAISPKMREDVYAVHDFKGKRNLRIKVLRKEFIVLLKSVTERDKDFEDILTIAKKDKRFDWQYLIDEVIWQHQHGDNLVLLDAEKTIKELKKYVFVEQKYLKQLYAVLNKR